MDIKDWEKAGGVKCPRCGKETVRLLTYGYFLNRQACPECRQRRIALMEYKQRVVTPRFRRR